MQARTCTSLSPKYHHVNKTFTNSVMKIWHRANHVDANELIDPWILNVRKDMHHSVGRKCFEISLWIYVARWMCSHLEWASFFEQVCATNNLFIWFRFVATKRMARTRVLIAFFHFSNLSLSVCVLLRHLIIDCFRCWSVCCLKIVLLTIIVRCISIALFPSLFYREVLPMKPQKNSFRIWRTAVSLLLE